MIVAENVSKRFGRLQVLQGVNMQCNAGECIVLIGPNGCGKTTLIKSILGMVIPDSGTLRVKGKDIRNDYRYRNDIGYMPQIGRYPENMRVGQVIETIRSLRPGAVSSDEDLIAQYKLPEISQKPMRTLSGGTTQKVSAALAFLFNPPILILDEPTAGLDPIATEVLKEKITEERKKGKLILITSHQLAELDDLVTQVIFMQEGRLKFHQPVEQLRAETGETRLSRAIAQVLKSVQP